MSNLFKIPARCALAVAVSSLLQMASAQTSTYTNAGVYTNVAPAGVKKVTFKLWGAGGGGSLFITNMFQIFATGGGGAFSGVTLDAQPGDTFVIVVGQAGMTNGASMGGAGSGNTEGGAPGTFNGTTGRSQGGQASSVFLKTNSLLKTKAVAGGGGGAGIGANGGPAGQPGQSQPSAPGGASGANGTGGFGAGGGGSGGNYNTNAITTGISALNQAGGNGGNGVVYSGGGGGGYGGGAGGGSNPVSNGSGGGGGGSYGTTQGIGSGIYPGNTSDPYYIEGAGQGGLPFLPGSDGLVVVLWIPTNPPAPVLTNQMRLGDGSFQFSFTNVGGVMFSALATTNVADSNGWTVLGTAAEISAGQFQFTDTQATNYPQRFYRVRSE